jgi:D-alanine--poly(phosphoribitol) ligase subunit 1
MYGYNLGIRFQTIAEAHAEKTAIWFSEREAITYGDLHRLSNRAGRWLIKRGVIAKDVVCLSGDKSLQTFAYMIACLKVGAVYCILDSDSPPERLRKILSTCQPKLLLAERNFLGSLGEIVANLGVAAVETASLAAEIDECDDANLAQTRRVTGECPAYIMFTSGSTGFPKGAVMTHANVLNLIEWSRATFAINSDDIVTNVNPLFFDNSVFDFYSSLFNGARLVPFSKQEVRNPGALVEKIDNAECTLWFSVPSLLIFLQTMKAADGTHLQSVRRFIFGGEGYPKAKLKLLYGAYSDNSQLFNVYGPTECTCVCSSYRITEQDFDDLRELPPLGHIADNFSYLILTDDNHAAAAGEIGELCLLGPNVGKGYYNDPELTEASFVQNPLNDKFREVMYKTGDLIRVDPADGKLHIHGRKDNQIKHMGYRIELEEIEVALHCLDYVTEAAVVHTNTNGVSRIVAIVSSREELSSERIRLDLKEIIPDYMIPSVFHREETLPKNSSGKVDRRYLARKYLGSEVAIQGARK